MIKRKFSKDPKVDIISLDEFYYLVEDYYEVKENLDFTIKPYRYSHKIKLTSEYFVCVFYKPNKNFYAAPDSIIIDSIKIAYRDGETEYNLINNKIEKLNKPKKNRTNPEIQEKISKMKKQLEFIPKFEKEVHKKIDYKFNEYIIDSGYKTTIDEFKNKFVVIDVETNGLRKSNDDLLSVSIYDPTSGQCYNRFFPLDLQPVVVNSYIHGITDKDLESYSHWTQDEVDKIIEYFNLKEKIILSYSGGGRFDFDFINNYCKRHNIKGFETLKYDNIKDYVSKSGMGIEGNMSKDNLCKLLNIEGVKEVHNSMNDCILEWKLYEKIARDTYFFLDEDLYKYNKGYVIPVTYLLKHRELASKANIIVPKLSGKGNLIFTYSLPKKIINKVKKFETNITGITLEKGIDYLLNVEYQDNSKFLINNKEKLDYINSIESKYKTIPVADDGKGGIISLDSQFDEKVDEINKVTKNIMENIEPVIDFIKKDIFKENKILSQELAFSENHKVMALCDLSNEISVLEIKTYDVIEYDNILKDALVYQLYYQSCNRKTYTLSIDYKYEYLPRSKKLIDIVFNIYEVDITEEKSLVDNLYEGQIKIIKILKENPLTSKEELSRESGYSLKILPNVLKALEKLGYIERESMKKDSGWKVIKDIE